MLADVVSQKVDICTKCGPCLDKDARQVSAAGLIADLVDALLSLGLDNCVVVSMQRGMPKSAC